uniref:C-type lectin domain-containing protein n=1 Tax=Oncorhynchus mykiss TaxID=8022 RepID=A0A8C7V0D7_ONCMY
VGQLGSLHIEDMGAKGNYVGTEPTSRGLQTYARLRENLDREVATQECLWLWSDGSRFYDRDNIQPDNYQGNENCTHVNWGEEKRWNYCICSVKLPAVCAMKL